MLQMHLMLPLHFVYKMLESGKMHFGCAKMHFCITFSKGKCSAYILRSKMFSITFCFAEHFPKENVQHQQNVTNAFLRTFDFVKCSASHFPKENVQQNKMYAPNAFLLQSCWMCSKNAFDAKMHFCNATMLTRMFSNIFIKSFLMQKKMFSCAKMHLMSK